MLDFNELLGFKTHWSKNMNSHWFCLLDRCVQPKLMFFIVVWSRSQEYEVMSLPKKPTVPNQLPYWYEISFLLLTLGCAGELVTKQ